MHERFANSEEKQATDLISTVNSHEWWRADLFLTDFGETKLKLKKETKTATMNTACG